MSVDDIRLRHREIIVPDMWTVHSDLLGQCIKDVREALAEVERLQEFEPKGGQQVGPSAATPPHGSISRLKQENWDLKAEVENLQVEVAWLETPMRARHKALLAAAEDLSTDDFHELWGKAKEGGYDKSLWSSFLFKIGRIQTAIDDCKRNGQK